MPSLSSRAYPRTVPSNQPKITSSPYVSDSPLEGSGTPDPFTSLFASSTSTTSRVGFLSLSIPGRTGPISRINATSRGRTERASSGQSDTTRGRPRFRGGCSLRKPSTARTSLKVSVESAYADLLICVNLRNSYRRGRQYPAARSIGLHWEGEMVCADSIWNLLCGKRAKWDSFAIIPPAFHVRLAGRMGWGPVDMSYHPSSLPDIEP